MFEIHLRRVRTASAAAPNSSEIGGAGTGVPLLPPWLEPPVLVQPLLPWLLPWLVP